MNIEDFKKLQRWMDSERDAEPPPPLTGSLKCPKCKAWAFHLWMIYGVSYYKCEHCGHRTPNL